MEFTKVGLIVNPTAGLGEERNLAVAGAAIAALSPARVLTGPGNLGADATPHAEIIPIPEVRGRAATQHLASGLIAAGVDVLVVIGGDGTLADVAFILVNAGSSCPILGIGAGSTNVGDLIICRADAVEQVREARLWVEPVNALVAGCNGQDLALAFNDVVIGATIVGTLHGNVCDLDAAAFVAGERKVGHPQPVGSAMSVVTKVANGRTVEVARGAAVGTLIAGFANYECFYGKAIVGGVCLTDLTRQPAGCLVSDQPLVRTVLSVEELRAVEPLHSAYISLNQDEVIHTTGIGPPAFLIADGNPLKALLPEDIVSIRVRPQAVQVLRLQAGENHGSS